ncbi:MAG: hypothetical protein ABW139_06520 [Candidatus Thiodiazotropha sp. DIVDIV]
MSNISPDAEGMDFLNPNPTKDMLRTARHLAGINYGEAAELCGIEESYYRKEDSSKAGHLIVAPPMTALSDSLPW